MPKHFLPLIGEKSLFQVTYESLRKKFEAKDIYVSTNEMQSEIALIQESEIPKENFILEPEMRNQGPATGLIAAFLKKTGKADEPFILVQPDDLREPEEKFFEMMDVCDRLAKETGKYITGGIKYGYGLMGVDYLVPGERVSREDEVGVFNVKQFLWRETKEVAEKYVHEMGALVHSNHTCMTPDKMLEMLKKYKMEWYEPLMNYVNGADLKAEYAKMPKGPVEDVAQLAHEAGESLVVELPFKWFGIGTWESTDKYLKEAGIYKQDKDVIEIECKDNFYSLPEGKMVATIGLDNIVVVDTGDALLICKKDQSGRVGEVVDKLKQDGEVEYL